MAKREYIETNKRWLEEKAKEEGVLALPHGIYYKVLKQGDPKGAQPSKRSIVTAPLYGVDHQRQEVRLQPWRQSLCLPPQ